MGITKERIETKATELGCDPAAIIAVDRVESGGSGFLEDGKTPKILFEPHVFWKELRKVGYTIETLNNIAADNRDILYPTWGMMPYGHISQQHERLQRAVKINRDAALSSASWGRYQILGLNWKLCGCDSLQGFIDKMYKSEDDHLDCFVAFIKATHLDDELRQQDWAGFARGYNGTLYAKNRYDEKLYNAYAKARIELANDKLQGS